MLNRPTPQYRTVTRLLCCIGLAIALSAPPHSPVGPARSAELRAAGYSFSDELGGFRLISVTGEGIAANPFVIVEEIFETVAAILVIRRQADAAATQRLLRGAEFIYVAKTILNRTGRIWTGFDLELRQDLAKPSIYGDGLSFDQITRRDRSVASDRFAKNYRQYEPRDVIRFELFLDAKAPSSP